MPAAVPPPVTSVMKLRMPSIEAMIESGQPANATTLSPLLEEKAYSQVMLAQAQNADTRLTRRDIDMLLDRLQTANPESAQVAGTTDDEFRQKFAALARKKVGERPPEE